MTSHIANVMCDYEKIKTHNFFFFFLRCTACALFGLSSPPTVDFPTNLAVKAEFTARKMFVALKIEGTLLSDQRLLQPNPCAVSHFPSSLFPGYAADFEKVS